MKTTTTTTTNPTTRTARELVAPDKTRPAPRRTPHPATFTCPICGGLATLTGRGDAREFLCLDCTRFDLND